MSLRKKVLPLLTAAAISVTSVLGTGVFAAYNDEWGGRNQYTGLGGVETTLAPVVPAAPAAAVTSAPAETQAETGSDVVPAQTQQSAPQEATYGSFTDIPTTHWAFTAIEKCKEAHWFSGYPDGSFRPNNEILRSEAMKVFVQFLGLPLSEVTSQTYYDVEPTEWYAPYIQTGSYLFPARATQDGQKKFQPKMPITREDTVYALVQALGYGKTVQFVDESVLNMFSDNKSISTNLRPYLAWAVTEGLMSGYNDGTIAAQEPLTRAEFATILLRGLNYGFNPVPDPADRVMSKLEIDPSTLKEVNVGESFEISARIYYTDGSDEDYTNHLNPYTDSIEGVVTINKNKVTAVGEGTVLINYNDEKAADQNLVVVVKDPNASATPEPTPEPPTPEPKPEEEGMITGSVDKEPIKVDPGKRYTVLAMDVSGSMYGAELTAAKDAAKSFCNKVLGQGSSDYVAIVQYDTTSTVVSDFSNDLSALTAAIDQMSAGGATNIYGGLEDAETLLDNVSDPDVYAKSIILMTDGYPCAGPTSSTGKYSTWYYEYTNPIYDKSQEIIGKNYDMYTVGFYTGSYDTQALSFLKDIQNKGFYLAENTKDLEDVFDELAEKIVVSGVTVELKSGDKIIDSCKTTVGACEFAFTVKEGDYTLEVSAPGYVTETQQVTVSAQSTTTVPDIYLSAE